MHIVSISIRKYFNLYIHRLKIFFCLMLLELLCHFGKQYGRTYIWYNETFSAFAVHFQNVCKMRTVEIIVSVW